jgi:hypothetical protein
MTRQRSLEKYDKTDIMVSPHTQVETSTEVQTANQRNKNEATQLWRGWRGEWHTREKSKLRGNNDMKMMI